MPQKSRTELAVPHHVCPLRTLLEHYRHSILGAHPLEVFVISIIIGKEDGREFDIPKNIFHVQAVAK
jgi:hypothetical protein